MRVSTKCTVLGMALGLVALALPAGAQTVKVLKKTPYAVQSGAPQVVKDECQLDTKLPEALASVADVQLVDKLGGGRTLELVIRDVHAPGGGMFSGPKWMTVNGTLKQGGKAVGSFRARRNSITGGGTCGMLHRCVGAIADAVAEWLKSPTQDATLGDAR